MMNILVYQVSSNQCVFRCSIINDGYASIHMKLKICLFQYHISEYLAHALVKWIHMMMVMVYAFR